MREVSAPIRDRREMPGGMVPPSEPALARGRRAQGGFPSGMRAPRYAVATRGARMREF